MTDETSGPPGSKGRKFVRVRIRLPADFKIVGDPTEKRYRATTVNISRGGLCLHLERDQQAFLKTVGNALPLLEISPALFTPHDRSATPPEGAWMKCRAGWMKTPADAGAPVLLGVKFNELTLSDAEKINAFLTDALRKNQDTSFDRKKHELLSMFSKKK